MAKMSMDLINKLESRIADVEYFTLESEEDFLTFDRELDRFSACDDELTCGRKIEIYNDSDDSWDIVRIESSNKYNTDENP